LAIAIGYLYWEGFPQQFSDRVKSSLQEKGIAVTFSNLYLNPFSGVVADDVIFMDNTGRDIARVSRVQFGISIWRLMRGINPIYKMKVESAELRIPLLPDSKDDDFLIFSNTSATAQLIGEKTLKVEELTGVMAGIRFKIGAELLLNPLPTKTPRTPEQEAARIKLLRQIINITHKVKFDKTPVLEAHFSGDLGSVESWQGYAYLYAANLTYRNTKIHTINVKLNVYQSLVSVEDFALETSAGGLNLSGFFDFSTRKTKFSISSDFDFTKIEDITENKKLAFLKDVKLSVKPVFYATVQDLQGSGTIAATGRLILGHFIYKGTSFEKLEAPFNWAENQVILSAAELADTKGSLKLNCLINLKKKTFRGDVHCSLNPMNMAPLATEKTQKYFLLFTKISTPPEIIASFSGEGSNAQKLVLDGNLDLNDFSLAGIPFIRATSHFKLSEGKMLFDKNVLERKEGKGSGTLIYDFVNQTLEVKDFQAKLFPIDIATILGEKSVRAIKDYQFKDAPTTRTTGLIDYKTGEKTNVKVKVQSGRVQYPVKQSLLEFQSANATLHIVGNTLTVNDFRGRIYDGAISGTSKFWFEPSGKTRYEMKIILNDVNFQKLTLSLFKYGESSGKMDGDGSFTGVVNDWTSFNGKGAINLNEGKVLSIPFMGGFSKLLGSALPGLGYANAERAYGNYVVESGVIKVEEIKIESTTFVVICKGNYSIEPDKLAMDARVNIRAPLLSQLGWLVSKIFEYHANGTFSEPNWQPKNF